jgi:hypothetical protein
MLRVGMPISTLCVVWVCDKRGTQSVRDGIPTETVGTSGWQSVTPQQTEANAEPVAKQTHGKM